MSEAFNTADQDAPSRGRQPRADANATDRRRRSAGSLNRMVSFKLDIFTPDQLDLENYVYLWANDDGANIRQLTQLDDYDFVASSDIKGGFSEGMTDSESTDRIRVLAGNKKDGAPLYTYYLKKRRAFWDADQESIVRNREDMMAGVVYRGEAAWDGEERPGGSDKFYAPSSNQLGHAGERRRGPVPRKL